MRDAARASNDESTTTGEKDAPAGPRPRQRVVAASTCLVLSMVAAPVALSAGCRRATTGGFRPVTTGAPGDVDTATPSPIVTTVTPSPPAPIVTTVAPSPPTFEARSVDGSGNDLAQPGTGCTDVALLRLTFSDYADGVSAPAGPTRPSARAISNAVHAQDRSVPNTRRASDLFWSWGQFLDHDLDLTAPAEPSEPFPILVPRRDRVFGPAGACGQVIPLNRSSYVPGVEPREQVNLLTAWHDASMIYGSDAARQALLRTNDGTGRLRVDASDGVGDLLPRDAAGRFLAGDVRVNENVLLTSMHTLWVREHNRVADLYRTRYPTASDDEVYELARRWVGAELQAITYEEWLPLLLGPAGLPPYAGYEPRGEAGIYSEFSAALFRLGHTLLSDQLLRLDATLASIPAGPLALRDAFDCPQHLLDGGIEPLLRGAATQTCQELDPLVVDGVRNFLFGSPGQGGLDLASLNIQRGRDHGLPSYNDVRRSLGLRPRASFAEVTSNPRRCAALRSVYRSVDDIDLWTGALCEDHLPGAMVGELLAEVLRRQFAVLRDRDRFFYRWTFSGSELAELEATRLMDVIRRNTTIGAEVQDTAFETRP